MIPLKYVNSVNNYSKITVNFKSCNTKRTNFTSNELFKDVESIQKALKTIAIPDPFKGMLLDFTKLQALEIPKEYKIFKNILLAHIEAERQNGIHVLGLKVPSNEGAIMKVAIECGFLHHHANAEYSLLNLCLKGHKIKECPFPAYKTVSAGVTAVIFDSDLKKVLIVTEKTGITKAKPPTGGIDYGVNQDTPLKAVIREVKEEINIDVKEEDAVFVGTGWSNNYRQNNPDICYVFAFCLKEMQQTVIQESEIEKAGWVSLDEFAVLPEDEIEKPWLLRNVVYVALRTLKEKKGYKKETFYLTTGKLVEFYGVSSPKTILKNIDGKSRQIINFE